MAATSTWPATSAHTMNGSLPPISRFTRATRSAHAAATRLPVATEPVNATPSTRGSRTIASPTSPAPATALNAPGGRCSKHEASISVESGVSSDGLATTVLPGRERRRQLPAEQQQRVVPGHDAAPHADRLLQHERQLGGLDRGDHAAGEVAAHLGVVVERRGGPAHLVAVLEQRLPALERHHPRDLVGAGPQAVGHLVEQLGALHRRASSPTPARPPTRPRSPRPPAPARRRGGRRASPRWPGSRRPAAARCPRPARRRSAVASPRAATIDRRPTDSGCGRERLLHRVRLR